MSEDPFSKAVTESDALAFSEKVTVCTSGNAFAGVDIANVINISRKTLATFNIDAIREVDLEVMTATRRSS